MEMPSDGLSASMITFVKAFLTKVCWMAIPRATRIPCRENLRDPD